MKPTLLSLTLLGLAVAASAQNSRSYIVVFNEGTDLRAFSAQGALPPGLERQDRAVVGAVQYLQNRHGFTAEHVYSHAIRGFSARLTDMQAGDLRNSALVALVEPDGEMHAIAKPAAAQTLPWGVDNVDADLSSALAGNGSGAVSNVNVYVIDTGVYTTATDINLVGFVNFVDRKDNDCNGHGTHVAGTIAAIDDNDLVVGVAPGAPVTAVKVLNCQGSGATSGVIAGVDWVTANAKKPAIANMSLGGAASTALDQAVLNSAASGVFYSLAAGNEGVDACTTSPARAGAGTNNGVMTVAALDSSGAEPSWSNYGSCVDVWAPGVNILSLYQTRTATMSGTSMASPHTGGGGALVLSGNPNASPATVEQLLRNAAVNTGKKSKDGRTIVRLNVAAF